MKPIIKVENLSKQYIIGGKQESYSTFRESLVNTMRLPLEALKRGNRKNGASSFWALKDINFEVMPGEVVGIIGRNGAGKSTLLKILSRITEPTGGKIELYGRIGSLLEVGTGFHPELTGRENIFLNGAIMGMKREEIAKKFDEIVDFAEIEEFLDTPVKRYSSGMYTRLAFAVAANLDPEVLVIDEVLAVGDANFQKKCLGKMSAIAQTGRTVLFVSHNMTAVKSLCTFGIYMQNGKILNSGKVHQIVDDYVSGESLSSRKDISETIEEFTVDWIEFTDNGIPGNFDIDKDLIFNVKVKSERTFDLININLFFNAAEGGVIFATCSSAEQFENGEYVYECKIPANTLNDNLYTLDLMVVTDQSRVIHDIKDILLVQGIESHREGSWLGKFPGLVRPLYFEWNKSKLINE